MDKIGKGFRSRKSYWIKRDWKILKLPEWSISRHQTKTS